MNDRERAARQAREFFDGLWKQGDYWELESSEFEQARYAHLLELLGDRRYGRALEIGCGAGAFTGSLASLCDRVLALDVSAVAIDRASQRGLGPTVELRHANIMEAEPEAEGPWDLIVMTETLYYLGWLYSFFDVGWLAYRLFGATAPGGRLLLANTCHQAAGYLLEPWLIRTYHALFINVGFRLEREETFRGTKNGVDLDVLVSVFERRPEPPHD